jgi:integrase
MTPDELERLILVARFKPLADYARIRLVGGKNKEIYAANPITIDNILGLAEQARSMKHAARSLVKFETQGIKWALIYRCLALVGLRWGELRTLEVGRFEFAANMVTLDSCYTKNGNADRLPVPPDLCRDLQEWIEMQKLTSHCRLFHMQQRGCQKFDRDIQVAGIEKVDAMGRSVDLHALRVSFVTMLAKYNVPTVLAQKLARHSSPLITQRIYMDADSLDSRAASNTLPALGSYREPVEEPKAVAPAIPTPSANDGLLKALLETADPETLRKALLKSLGQ